MDESIGYSPPNARPELMPKSNETDAEIGSAIKNAASIEKMLSNDEIAAAAKEIGKTRKE